MRCDYCEYRNSWTCEDWKVDNNYMCEAFKLDFDSLTDEQRKEIQKRLMGVDNE